MSLRSQACSTKSAYSRGDSSSSYHQLPAFRTVSCFRLLDSSFVGTSNSLAQPLHIICADSFIRSQVQRAVRKRGE